MTGQKLDYELRIELAKAVAEPGTDSLLICAMNQAAGWKEPEDAARLDQCHAVQVREGILALDLDHALGLDQAFRIAGRFRDLGFDAVVTESGRPGHAHLWARAGEYLSVLAAEAAQIVGAVGYGRGGGDRSGQRMRPPLGAHRHGGRSLIANMSAEDAAKALRPKKVSRPASRYLRLKEDSADRSAALISSAEAFIAARRSFGEWAKAVADHPDAKKYAARRNGGHQELKRCWEKGKERLCRIEALIPRRRDLSAFIAAAGTAPGLTRGPQKTLAVIYGIAERAEDSLAVHVSGRDLALAAGIELATSRRHLKILIEAGYLRIAQKATALSAARYELTGKLASRNEHTPSHPGGAPSRFPGGVRGGTQNLTLLTGMLGEALSGRPAAAAVWMALDSEPMTVAELAARMQEREANVRHHLRRLRDQGLAAESLGQWWRVNDPIAHRNAARDRCKLGRFARRRREFEEHRMAWRMKVKERIEASTGESLKRGWLSSSLKGANADREARIERPAPSRELASSGAMPRRL